MVPVKSEPGSSTTHVQSDAAGYSGDNSGAVALEDAYDENYDYGGYGEGYDDGSGMIDPNTGLPLAGVDGSKGEISFSFINQSYTCQLQSSHIFPNITSLWLIIIHLKGP